MSHRSGANPPTTTGSAAAVQADAQLFDKAVQPIERGGSGFDRPGEQWPGDCHHVRAQCDHLGRIHAGADATGSDQRDVRQRRTHLHDRLCGRNTPVSQVRVAPP